MMTKASSRRVMMARSAVLSPCGAYRYELRRSWPDLFGSPDLVVNFVMLNPSTADASKDDPTIRRCIGFAKDWGYSGLVVTNLFAFRATDPAVMRKAADPIGPDNDRHILDCARAASLVVAAWGTGSGFKGRPSAVLAMLRGAEVHPLALALTKGGLPRHPLYVPATATLVPLA